ncbi:hypothetical protein INR76_04320 [Marixanthomonas sp. SCSIO 43207]|uniref:hypothetical protein n=1 Tax=Marixanthomonas sp. SCSIO 43207 TaxID=2779360 RepID=UPI001CA942BE|nr:hypothetical protein [Marixanthomonas sp. SCSIO 43207]UAB81990.1 hypothetical protein INR76_04320 [Marixanthomonas sp. SCSIO 43207]
MLRLKSIFFLLIFTTFLLTPAAVHLADGDVNMTSYFSMNEEENTDCFKVGPKHDNSSENNLIPDFYLGLLLKKQVQSPYLKFWKPIYYDTLSPPPEGINS